MSATATRLQEASEYLDRGWAVLPLRPASKEPHHEVLREVHGTTKWKPLAERRASRPEIQAWFDRDPATQVGVILGQPSGGLVVVDQDKPVSGLKHPPGPTVQTGRGRHLYALADRRTATVKHAWGEVRGDGSYVVAPTGMHPSGAEYLWRVRPEDCELPNLADFELDGATIEPGCAPSGHFTQGTPYGTALGESKGVYAGRARVLGIHPRIGSSFRCVLPGHTDSKPSASVDPASGRYHDWHRAGARQWYTLAEVYASRVAGREVELTPQSASRWWDRLDLAAGLLDVKVPAPPKLPRDIDRVTLRVVEGFVLLAALRGHRDPGEPVPYTRRFIADWCGGLTEYAAEKAKLRALELGALVKDGEHRKGGQRTSLYRIGGQR